VELAEKINLLLDDDELRARIGEAGRAAVQPFQADAVIERYARGLQAIAAGPDAHPTPLATSSVEATTANAVVEPSNVQPESNPAVTFEPVGEDEVSEPTPAVDEPEIESPDEAKAGDMAE